MFDMLTLDQLYALHTSLCATHFKLYRRLVGVNGQPLIDPTGPDWAIITAAQNELHETVTAVYAEITRRHEQACADA
jgi:hypothetical protein